MPFVNSEYGPLKRVLLCRPEYLDITVPINVIAANNKEKGVNVGQACREHDEFVRAFQEYGVEVLLAPTSKRYPYEVNTRDLGVTTPKGIIFGRYLRELHWGEHRLAEQALHEKRIPILTQLPFGTFEGGDFMYVDKDFAGIGIGCRTNMIGVHWLQALLADTGITLMPVDFDKDYLHLDMICNIIAPQVCVICTEAVSPEFYKELKKRNFTFIDVSPSEVFDHACNLLSIGNNTIFSHPKARKVNERLRALGLNVLELPLMECLKSGGGPRCMSFPIERDET